MSLVSLVYLVYLWAAAALGDARTRVLRGLHGARRSVRPRRARCRDCATTHVLLPADVPLRCADTIEVVAAALLATRQATGTG